MRVVDGVADVGEPPQQPAHLERPPAGVGTWHGHPGRVRVRHGLEARATGRPIGMEAVDGLLEAVALDEPHGVIRPAVAVGPQAVDRDDPRMFQAAGDLGLEQEAGAAGRVVGVLLQDLLDRHLAVQLLVERDEDGAQAAPGVRAQDAEALAIAGGRAEGVAGGPIVVRVRLDRRRADPGQRGLDIGVAEPGEALASRTDRRRSRRGSARCRRASGCAARPGPRPRRDGRRPGRRGPAGDRPGHAACRESRPGSRRRAGPGRSTRSAARTGRRGDCGRRQSCGGSLHPWRLEDERWGVGGPSKPANGLRWPAEDLPTESQAPGRDAGPPTRCASPGNLTASDRISDISGPSRRWAGVRTRSAGVMVATKLPPAGVAARGGGDGHRPGAGDRQPVVIVEVEPMRRPQGHAPVGGVVGRRAEADGFAGPVHVHQAIARRLVGPRGVEGSVERQDELRGDRVEAEPLDRLDRRAGRRGGRRGSGSGSVRPGWPWATSSPASRRPM